MAAPGRSCALPLLLLLALAGCGPRRGAAVPQRVSGGIQRASAATQRRVSAALQRAAAVSRPGRRVLGSVRPTVGSCRTSDGRPGHCVSSLTGYCAAFPSLPLLLAAPLSLCRLQGPGLAFCCPDTVPAAGRLAALVVPTPPPPRASVTSTSTRTRQLTVTSVTVVTLRPTTTVTLTQVVTVDVTRTAAVTPSRVVAPPLAATALRPPPSVSKQLSPPPAPKTTTTTTTTTQRPTTTTKSTTTTTTTTTTERSTTSTARAGVGGCGGGDGSSWVALVGSRDRWLCSGALIGRRLVITAARCVASRDVSSLTVRLGELDLSSSTDSTPTDMTVERAVLHPRRSGGTHDLALLLLSGPPPSGPPVCLPAPAPAAAPALVTLGWGLSPLSVGSPAVTVLTATAVREVASADCDAAFRQLPTYGRQFPSGVGGTELCVAAVEEDSAERQCPADRGGPLLAVDGSGRSTLQGIARLAAGCGSDVLPNVYIRVQHYLPWIRQVAERLA